MLITLISCKWCESGTYLTTNEPYRLTNARLSLALEGARYSLFIGNESQAVKFIGSGGNPTNNYQIDKYFLTIPNNMIIYIAT
jgi:hypothetical protein